MTLFLLIFCWTILTKRLKHRRNYQKKSSKLETEADPNFSDQTTSKLVRKSAHSYRKDTTYRTLERRLFEWFTVWDVATCCLGLIIYHSHTQACSFRPPISTTVCANGVRGLRSQRQIRGPQVRTLRRLPTSEFTL